MYNNEKDFNKLKVKAFRLSDKDKYYSIHVEQELLMYTLNNTYNMIIIEHVHYVYRRWLWKDEYSNLSEKNEHVTKIIKCDNFINFVKEMKGYFLLYK
jgi:hypothetical protein